MITLNEEDTEEVDKIIATSSTTQKDCEQFEGQAKIMIELLRQKKLQLKTAQRLSKKAARIGRHNWGDFHRNQHIKQLEHEIQIICASIKSSNT